MRKLDLRREVEQLGAIQRRGIHPGLPEILIQGDCLSRGQRGSIGSVLRPATLRIQQAEIDGQRGKTKMTVNAKITRTTGCPFSASLA